MTGRYGRNGIFLIIGLLISGILFWPHADSTRFIAGVSAQQAVRPLSAFTPVTGSLGNGSPLENAWQFEGQAGQVISLVARALDGDLDPVVELYDPQNQLLAANDNGAFDDLDARIEGYVLPVPGNYSVRVYREGLEKGSSSGRYELRLLFGFSVENPAEATTQVVRLDAGSRGTEQTILPLPTLNFYTTLEMMMPMIEQPYQLTWRFHVGEQNGLTWVFEHNTQGVWELSVENARQVPIRVTNGVAADILPLPGEAMVLEIWFHEEQLEIKVNEQVLVTMISLENWVTPGEIRLSLALENDPATTTLLIPLRNFHVTTPFYLQDPVIAGAIAPTPPGERLYSYQGTAQEIVAELQALGFIPEDGIGIQSIIHEGYIFIGAAGFRAYPLEERPFRDFALSFRATLFQGTLQTACGVIFRQEDGANFATILFTPSQGLYFLQYHDGVVNQNGLATLSPALLPELATTNHFLIVADGGRGQLFVNGRLVGEIALTPVGGPILSHLVLDIDTPAYCEIDDLWLWSFDR